MSYFPSCNYLNISDTLPVNVTFNHAILECIKYFGKFDSYIYMACDALLQNENTIQGLHDLAFSNDKYGLISAQIDRDSCYAYGLKLGGGRHIIDDENARYEMFKNGDYIVPPGRACAAHVQLYKRDIVEYYGRACPDLFAGYCTESVFSFIVAAIRLNWVISKYHLIQHYPSLDIPSAGFRPEKRTQKPYDHPFMVDTLLPIFQNDYAKSLGLGYEECQNIVVHNPSQFDENYFCKNDKLKEYIRDNLYLSKDIFDYNTINSTFIQHV